jgi:hypothetical protein
MKPKLEWNPKKSGPIHLYPRYVEKLDPKNGRLTQRDDALVTTFNSVDDLLGTNSRFYAIHDHFKSVLADVYGGDLVPRFYESQFRPKSFGQNFCFRYFYA